MKQIHYIKNDSKKPWSTLNEILGKKSNSAPSFIESGGSFITKPTYIANYFNNLARYSKFMHDMTATNADTTHPSITDEIMKEKHCNFEFGKLSVEEVKEMSINNDKPPGSDNLDGKLLRITDDIATPVCHIFNLSLQESVCPLAWREAKVILLPKNSKPLFTGSNRLPGAWRPSG